MTYGDIKPGMMKYCVVGNIVKRHIDEQGKVRHGTQRFPGGRKVYLTRIIWENGVLAWGNNKRMSRYEYDIVPFNLIENVRSKREFDPFILMNMDDTLDYPHNSWWSYKDRDKAETEKYVEVFRKIQNGDNDALEEYLKENKMGKYWTKR